MNGPCPSGHFCPAGTTDSSGSQPPQPCPAGYFNPNKRGESLADCQPCLAGMACGSPGLPWPDLICQKGYYCNIGAESDTESPCLEGFYCPLGSSEPKPCPVGYYQDVTRQDFCEPCPAGKICDAKGLSAPNECPKGSYCLGTVSGSCDSNGTIYELGKLDPVDGTQLIRCGCDNKNKLCAPCSADCSEERAPTPCPRGRYEI